MKLHKTPLTVKAFSIERRKKQNMNLESHQGKNGQEQLLLSVS